MIELSKEISNLLKSYANPHTKIEITIDSIQQTYPSISGSITVKWGLDLKKGDKVPFIYEPLQINTYIQVVGIKKYPAIPNKPPEITLSNTKKTMTSILAGLAKKGVVR